MKFWQILISILIITSCQINEDCKNENYLIRPLEKDVTIKLDYNQNQESLIEDVEELFSEDLCWNEKILGIEIGNKLLKTIFQKTCVDGTIRNIPISEVKILMNQKGETLLNNQIIHLDSVANWIENHFPNETDYETEEIFFLWTKESPKEKIEKVFNQITNGYLKSYNKIANKIYGKEFCELELSKVKELENTLKFRIKLGFGKVMIPPPPLTEEQIKEFEN